MESALHNAEFRHRRRDRGKNNQRLGIATPRQCESSSFSWKNTLLLGASLLLRLNRKFIKRTHRSPNIRSAYHKYRRPSERARTRAHHCECATREASNHKRLGQHLATPTRRSNPRHCRRAEPLRKARNAPGNLHPPAHIPAPLHQNFPRPIAPPKATKP